MTIDAKLVSGYGAEGEGEQTRRGFSLIEVLISIVILALGLLGLGVLFPVVIREQRLGTDQTAGVLVANNARAVLENTQFRSWKPNGNPSAVTPQQVRDVFYSVNVWKELRDSASFTGLNGPQDSARPTRGREQIFEFGEWYIPTDAALGSVFGIGSVAMGDTGRPLRPINASGTPLPGAPTGACCVLGTPPALATCTAGLTESACIATAGGRWVGANTTCQVDVCGPQYSSLSLASRLYPMDVSTPRYVWDFAVQRITDFNTNTLADQDGLRVAIFVRRVDPRIRTDQGVSLLRAFTDETLPVTSRRVPVGADATTGQPTLDGTDGSAGAWYSWIRVASVQFWFQDQATSDYRFRDRLYVPSLQPLDGQFTAQQVYSYLKQPGQKLVDNLGNVYTVVGDGPAGNVPGVLGYIQIDPPVPARVETGRSFPAVNSKPEERAIREVIYTPQIPVSVTTYEPEVSR